MPLNNSIYLGSGVEQSARYRSSAGRRSYQDDQSVLQAVPGDKGEHFQRCDNQ
jgi:hypothetical protein